MSPLLTAAVMTSPGTGPAPVDGPEGSVGGCVAGVGAAASGPAVDCGTPAAPSSSATIRVATNATATAATTTMATNQPPRRYLPLEAEGEDTTEAGIRCCVYVSSQYVISSLSGRTPATEPELVAAGVSAILGSQWGVDALLSGFVQGAAAELVFAILLYRVWTFPVLATAAVAAAAAAWIHDWVLYYAAISLELQLARGVLMAVSAIVLVAGGSVILERALRRAGVLEGFRA